MADMVADMVANMEVDMVADTKVDMVADMEVDNGLGAFASPNFFKPTLSRLAHLLGFASLFVTVLWKLNTNNLLSFIFDQCNVLCFMNAELPPILIVFQNFIFQQTDILLYVLCGILNPVWLVDADPLQVAKWTWITFHHIP